MWKHNARDIIFKSGSGLWTELFLFGEIILLSQWGKRANHEEQEGLGKTNKIVLYNK